MVDDSDFVFNHMFICLLMSQVFRAKSARISRKAGAFKHGGIILQNVEQLYLTLWAFGKNLYAPLFKPRPDVHPTTEAQGQDYLPFMLAYSCRQA